jgi:hypothetical protein
MTAVAELRHYNDIRKLVPAGSYRAALSYISWHNRLTMTDMLEVWEALVVAFAFDKKEIDPFLYPRIKAYLAQTGGRVPLTSEDCELRAHELIVGLFGSK